MYSNASISFFSKAYLAASSKLLLFPRRDEHIEKEKENINKINWLLKVDKDMIESGQEEKKHLPSLYIIFYLVLIANPWQIFLRFIAISMLKTGLNERLEGWTRMKG